MHALLGGEMGFVLRRWSLDSVWICQLRWLDFFFNFFGRDDEYLIACLNNG